MSQSIDDRFLFVRFVGMQNVGHGSPLPILIGFQQTLANKLRRQRQSLLA